MGHEIILLKDTIEHFHDYILDRSQVITQQVVGQNVEFKQERLTVYHEAYVLRLLEVLGKNYIGLKQLIGEALFEKLARDYVRTYPSHHFSVSYFGRHFSKFLAGRPGVKPLWVELAQFEWVMQLIIEAKDAPQLTFEDMKVLDPEAWANLILIPHPSLQIIPFFYPIPQLWQALRHDSKRPALKRHKKPVQWLMWRFNQQVFFFATNHEQYVMMQALERGENFSQVCEGLCKIMDEENIINFAAQTLRQWITEGVFSEFRV
jgi:hypothetical protein